MKDFFKQTFGGLSTAYLVRQFFFGVLIFAFHLFILTQGESGHKVSSIIFFTINTLLYPYSRFVYERVIGFVMGENIFFVNALLMLITKIITMIMCWILATLIAPIGLLYIYFYHKKMANN